MDTGQVGVWVVSQAEDGRSLLTSRFLNSPIPPQNPVFMAFLASLALIMVPDPPETVFSRVFLGITFSMRPVLSRVKSPWRYVVIPTPGKSWLKTGDKRSDPGQSLYVRC